MSWAKWVLVVWMAMESGAALVLIGRPRPARTGWYTFFAVLSFAGIVYLGLHS